jgi:V8-like Glu-specific endopeptidase
MNQTAKFLMEEIIVRIKKEIARGRVGRAIEVFLAETEGKFSDAHDDALALSERFRTLERKSMRGSVSDENARIERSNITAALLDMLKDLSTNNGASPPQKKQNDNKLRWDEFLRWLNRVFAGSVYETRDIRSLATSFGLPVISMNWDSNARTHWFNILDFYVKRDQNGEKKEDIRSIIKYVMDNYGSDPSLEKALKWESPKGIEPELKEDEYNKKVGEDSNFEKLMKKGVNTLLPIWFLETGIERGKSVGRIETDEQYGTGFLLKNNYLLTNHHVISNKAEAEGAFVEMNVEKDISGRSKKKKRYTFDVSKEEYFATSEEDDWTIVKLSEDANADWGFIQLNSIDGLKKDDRVVIIQHPEGEHKQIGLHNNFITYVDDNIIMYLTDTLEGSSGSPVFNHHWELVGLHNKGGFLREPTNVGKVWRNGGININKVLKGIQANNIPGF